MARQLDSGPYRLRSRHFFPSILVIPLFISLLLLSCGDRPTIEQGQVSNEATPKPAPSQAENEASALLTKADVEEILSEPMREVRPSKSSGIRGGENQPSITNCTYDSVASSSSVYPNRSVHIWFRRSPLKTNDAPEKLQEMKDTEEKSGSIIHPISGIGERAFWSSNDALKIHELKLFVQKEGALLIITVIGIPDDTTGLEKAKSLMMKALSRL